MIRIERKITTTTKIARTTSRTMMKIWPMNAPTSIIRGVPFCRRFDADLDGRAEDGKDVHAGADVERGRHGRRELRRPRLAVVELDRPVAVHERGDHSC